MKFLLKDKQKPESYNYPIVRSDSNTQKCYIYFVKKNVNEDEKEDEQPIEEVVVKYVVYDIYGNQIEVNSLDELNSIENLVIEKWVVNGSEFDSLSEAEDYAQNNMVDSGEQYETYVYNNDEYDNVDELKSAIGVVNKYYTNLGSSSNHWTDAPIYWTENSYYSYYYDTYSSYQEAYDGIQISSQKEYGSSYVVYNGEEYDSESDAVEAFIPETITKYYLNGYEYLTEDDARNEYEPSYYYETDDDGNIINETWDGYSSESDAKSSVYVEEHTYYIGADGSEYTDEYGAKESVRNLCETYYHEDTYTYYGVNGEVFDNETDARNTYEIHSNENNIAEYDPNRGYEFDANYYLETRTKYVPDEVTSIFKTYYGDADTENEAKQLVSNAAEIVEE